MSQYFNLYGHITIPAKYNYRLIIKKLELYDWLDIEDMDDLNEYNSEGDECNIEIEENEEKFIIYFDGWIRNYGRHINRDLIYLSNYPEISAYIFSTSKDGIDTAEIFKLKNTELTYQSLFDAPVIVINKNDPTITMWKSLFESLGYIVQLKKIDQKYKFNLTNNFS